MLGDAERIRAIAAAEMSRWPASESRSRRKRDDDGCSCNRDDGRVELVAVTAVGGSDGKKPSRPAEVKPTEPANELAHPISRMRNFETCRHFESLSRWISRHCSPLPRIVRDSSLTSGKVAVPADPLDGVRPCRASISAEGDTLV